MSEILQTNIFFLIASVATILFSVFLCIALFYIIKILKLAKSIIQKIESGSEVLAGDLAQIRQFFTGGGLLTRFLTFFMGSRAAKRRRKHALEEDTD